ncbi:MULTISPECIES: hypothetical protein [Bradyrhizobium]|jgi:hypothetical protein|uniref:hypothetical protein n=1 Tax=Bradyrhizobium TaxID=374 RepID=UPI000481823E|nr:MULTISPECIES: hypothetical protein [Bradyrhizobium]MCS3444848.1 putative integral membrane protein [Bradyrhizobium elkanii]MCS3564024.1 putative integral membrane protein [Bradyrhizobium elkanii]MCW2146144.1 putative integral membrane protein [Bradyrhizobium elkanii]MCW2354783.1 putative integral membrane protein [Bradyrhizobium elkanii]MCW2378971.1 putative integral membrane protein [Bradyrhizobium elkanii]
MSDTDEPPPERPSTPPSAAEGCLSMLMLLIGIVLLLPALCVVMAGLKSGMSLRAADFPILLVILAIALIGGWLIWLATRPRNR